MHNPRALLWHCSGGALDAEAPTAFSVSEAKLAQPVANTKSEDIEDPQTMPGSDASPSDSWLRAYFPACHSQPVPTARFLQLMSSTADELYYVTSEFSTVTDPDCCGISVSMWAERYPPQGGHSGRYLDACIFPSHALPDRLLFEWNSIFDLTDTFAWKPYVWIARGMDPFALQRWDLHAHEAVKSKMELHSNRSGSGRACGGKTQDLAQHGGSCSAYLLTELSKLSKSMTVEDSGAT